MERTKQATTGFTFVGILFLFGVWLLRDCLLSGSDGVANLEDCFRYGLGWLNADGVKVVLEFLGLSAIGHVIAEGLSPTARFVADTLIVLLAFLACLMLKQMAEL